jgi:hypothetical protein
VEPALQRRPIVRRTINDLQLFRRGMPLAYGSAHATAAPANDRGAKRAHATSKGETQMAGATFTRGGIQDKVAQKASDPAFRKSLIANPKSSLEKVLGAEIPKGVNVKVLEESADTYYVVLPHVTGEGAELDDASLEKVAGGMGDKAKCSATMSSIINISAG